ncbi:MAG: tripartite tricarboxylate transporter substrate binding protein [Burkholderiales bacterium]|nr:tripartite tricarboxylate transporter substrate binding protein [Burkholderiales bacterium]
MHTTHIAAGFLLLLVAASSVFAQAPAAGQYPNRPLRFIVPFPPGGGTDIGTRIIAQKLGARFSQQVVVDNRGGAAGIIGTELAAKAAPDGYTLMMGNIGTHAINISLYSKLPYDPVRDFVPVTQAAGLPLFVLVHPSLPVKSVKELIAFAKARPAQLNYSTSGSGGSMHVAAELFQSMASVKLTHIPYKGGAPAVADLLAGHVSLSFATVLETTSHVKAGKLRPLAVTSAKRSVAYPELPTVSEAGLPGYESISWLGVFVPAGTPKDIVALLNSEIVRILNMADVKERLLSQGAEPIGNTQEQFAAVLKADIAKYGKLMRDSGVKAE